MARADDTELIDKFEQFYRDYYKNEIAQLAQKYPTEQKSLYVDWRDLHRFDTDLADDFRNKPKQLREYAEEALRLYDLPVDVSLGRAHVRVVGLPERTDIREIRADHRGMLIAVQGIVRKATDVRPKITAAAFECQRCGTLSRIPQDGGDFQEPHECQGCERQGPFQINYDQSEFVDAQKIRVQESPEGLRGGETPQSVDVNIEDDITGEVTAGDHVSVTGVLQLEQQGSDREKSAMFDIYLDGVAVEIEDEEFEEMNITDEDKKEIVELSTKSNIYDRMEGAIAPSIYGYEMEKRAIIFQLFSGVTKHLPDGSRTRGDLHMLLIGDPGTGKCQTYETNVTLADGTERELGALVEERLDDPVEIEDGYYQKAALDVLTTDGEQIQCGTATKVWKREAPEQMYRIRTASGREVEVTPSHPLFVQRDGQLAPVVASELSEGEFVAAPRALPVAGDDTLDVQYDQTQSTVPNVGDTLCRVREALALSQFDCRVPRSTYQHYERGDRNPGRASLGAVVSTFEDRLAWLTEARERATAGDWETIVELREELNLSQATLAADSEGTQKAVSYYERNDAVPDGGTIADMRAVVLDRIDEALAVADDIRRLRSLAAGDICWDPIESIERVESDDDWVYDLEVEGTHNYIAEGLVSHNSALLQYVDNIAPRSVYTSGKGSSAAGLCVTGDTLVQTADGFREIRTIAEQDIPDEVATETSVERTLPLRTYDRERGEFDVRDSSHVWRMPEKPCRRIETTHGKELEASVNTPVLTCGDDGIRWTQISEVEPGDHVAVPGGGESPERSAVAVREFLELTEEKVRLTDDDIDRVRARLNAEFGTLRDAAAALGLSEDFVYDTLSNRHISLDELDCVLDGIGLTREDVTFERAMLGHGNSITLPETFDADLMYLLGFVFGDGDIQLNRRDGNRGCVRISNGNERLLERAASIVEAKFDKEVAIERQENRVPCIRIHNATIARLFANAGMESPKEGLALHSELTTAAHADAFLRGLMDADGSVSERDNGGSSVLLSTISDRLAEQMQLMLETYGVRARTRERDRRGTYELADGRPIESQHTQQSVEICGVDIDRYAEAIGFACSEKQSKLQSIADVEGRRDESLPIGGLLAASAGTAGTHHNYLARGSDPGRERAQTVLAEAELGNAAPAVEEAATADLRWDEVVAAVDTGQKEVFDLTVPETHNFLADGIVTHNTAAAVRDDFAEGQQWTLEAGALVLADRGVAAVDELDKMRCVTGETLVHTPDGIRPIREFALDEEARVERHENGRTLRGIDASVWTMTDDGRLTTRDVMAVHEYDAPPQLCEVSLASGESLTATPDHPFFVLDEGQRREKAADDLDAGDWVYVPDSVPQPAPDGGAVGQRSDSDAIAGSRADRSGESGAHQIGSAHGALVGYLAGDGNIYYDSVQGYGIRFTNTEEELLADFERVCREVLDATPVRHPADRRDNGVETVQVHGKAHVEELLAAGVNLETYEGKRVPDAVAQGSAEAKAAFLRALADSEGHVDSRKVVISSASYELLLGAKMLLSEFGVTSQIQTDSREEKRTVYILAITATDSLAAFRDSVGFTLDRKQAALEDACERTTGDRTVLDVLPECGHLFQQARERLRLHQSECGLTDATYCNFENGDANCSLSKAERVLERFETRRERARDDLQRLTGQSSWETLSALKERYHVSQRELAEGTAYSQQQVSRGWADDDTLERVVRRRLHDIVGEVSETEFERLASLVRGDLKWRRVAAVERAAPEATDGQIRLLRHRLADLLGVERQEASARAEELLETTPAADSWDQLRGELCRHEISLRQLADRLDVDQSTVSRRSTGAVDGEPLETVWPVARALIESKRERVRSVLSELQRRQEPNVYDLTVDGTHNFLANGMVVHNSEDQSAMHEALEQQSYHPETEILLADGRRVEIGDLVDERMADSPGEVVDGVDCEILPVDDLGIHTVDLETTATTKTGIDRVSRHEAPSTFVRVEFSNGREVLVTPEHPMFVDSDGELGTVEARDIEEGAFVPAPRKLPNSAEPVRLDPEPQVGKEKDIDLPETLSPALGEILGLLVAEGHCYAGSSHEIGFSNQNERLLERAERLVQSVFGMASSEQTNAAGTVTKRWISTKLYRWFESNFPGVMQTAREKRIPAAVLGASEEVIRRFLVGAFAGDGGVESEAMAFSTASEGLAQDYADALSKIGVASRIHHDTAEDSWTVYVMGDSTERFVDSVVSADDERHEKAQSFVARSNETPRHHDVLPPSTARELRELRGVLGLRLTGRYRPNLDEGYGVQRETVQTELDGLRDRVTAIRTALDSANDLGAVRSAVDWSGRELADRLDGVTGDTIHYAESGGYDANRRASLTRRARAAVESTLEDVERRIEALTERTNLRYYRVNAVEEVHNDDQEWVYDVTVEPTHTFVGQGVVLHNSISVSKAGINATLKSRCSLLGAANPSMGRFDEYEPIAEQIDLAPPLISRFDLIFTVTDKPDEEEDARLAEHIIQTNYAGELHTHRTEVNTSNYSEEEVERVTEEVAPTIEPELLRKYVAYAKRNCFPTMTEEAKAEIQEYYVDLRASGSGEESPVPVTARKLEALVRLAEASARVRLSDTVESEDAQRAIDIAQYCLEDIGLDPETGELDADVVETGTSKTQRDRVRNLLDIVAEIESEYDEGAPVEVILERCEEIDISEQKAEHEIDKLKQKGEVYEPQPNHLRTT